MIIKEIHIDGFGIFSDFSLTRFKKGINLLVGNNEAGKSTLLKFVRFTLFGYPRSIDDRMQPSRGGVHGGRIKTLFSTGNEVTFERMNGKNIRLIYDNKESQIQTEWDQLLGGATDNLFNNVYAVTLDELTDLNSLSVSGVEDKIFSVGLGLGGISIGEIEKRFEQQANKYYKGRGSAQEIPKILRTIEEKRKEIREIQENLPKYRELTEEIKLLEQEVSDLNNRLEELRRESKKMDNYLKCYGHFIDYTRAGKTLKTLPPLMDYPENGMGRLEKLEESEQNVKRKIAELLNGTEDEKGIEELKTKIADITFNSPLTENAGKVEFLRTNVEKYKTTVKDKKDDEQKVEKLNSAIKHEIENINSAWNEDTVKGFDELLVRKNRLEDFRKNFESFRQKRTDIEAEIKAMRMKESALNIKNIFSVIAGALLVSSVPAFYYGYHIAGAAAVAMAFILFFGKKYFVKKPGEIPVEVQLKEQRVQEELLKEEYNAFLKNELRLPNTLTPDAAIEALNTVKELKSRISERDELLAKIENERMPFIREFEEKTNALAELIPHIQDTGIAETAKQIVNEYDKSVENSELKKRLKEELERKIKKYQAAEKDLKEIRGEIEKLVTSVDANDLDDFRRKYEDNELVKELIGVSEDAVKNIENIAGFGKASEVIEYLNNAEKESIEKELRKKQNEISGLEEKLSLKKEELGGKKNEKERLEGESELAGALTEMETEIQKMNNAYREWLANKAALKILDMVKAQYEQEKQPAVIKSSGHYFSKITEGRYPRIRVSLDEKDVSVFDERETVKKINQLSRGTKEQLLISLRLGLIEEYEKQSEPLPVIVDEVLVNFDPGRARQTADILYDFSKERQILLFTCHPEMENLFNNEINKISI